MLITLKTLLHTLLLPPGGPLLLAFVGACLIGRCRAGRARRAGWALLAAGLAALWLLATPVVADVLSRLAQRCPPLDLSRALQAQAIVVLGGGKERLGAPEYGGEPAVELSLLARLNYAAFVARRTQLPVLVSGTPEEALAMRASLARDFNVQTRWVENRSRDTFENARFSARLLRPAGVTRIILVTDADHEWRALQEFAAAGFSVLPAPVGLYVRGTRGILSYLPNSISLTRSSQALYELIGDVVRELLGVLGLRRQSP